MRITITIDASDAEAVALLAKIEEIFGDKAQVEAVNESAAGEVTVGVPVDDAPAKKAPPAPPVPIPVEKTPPAPPPADLAPTGRGQIFKNHQLTGDTIVYGDMQIGPKDWQLLQHLHEGRPGGETQAVQCELKAPGNTFGGYERYISAQHGDTSLEMGGSFRTFHWEFRQGGVAVEAGRSYDLTAIFHPVIRNKQPDGSEPFMSQAVAGDWFANLEWRWFVKGPEDQMFGEDEWRDGLTLGTNTFELPFEKPHTYKWRWLAPETTGVTFGIEFRNKWGLAMTKVWLHELRCVELA